jgi:hypothetical protein
LHSRVLNAAPESMTAVRIQSRPAACLCLAPIRCAVGQPISCSRWFWSKPPDKPAAGPPVAPPGLWERVRKGYQKEAHKKPATNCDRPPEQRPVASFLQSALHRRPATPNRKSQSKQLKRWWSVGAEDGSSEPNSQLALRPTNASSPPSSKGVNSWRRAVDAAQRASAGAASAVSTTQEWGSKAAKATKDAGSTLSSATKSASGYVSEHVAGAAAESARRAMRRTVWTTVGVLAILAFAYGAGSALPHAIGKYMARERP